MIHHKWLSHWRWSVETKTRRWYVSRSRPTLHPWRTPNSVDYLDH